MSRARVDEFLLRFGQSVGVDIPPLDKEGYAQLRRGSATIGINVLEERGVLVFLSPMLKVPAERREELYRFLLERNFLATSDAAFAIDEKKDMIFLRAMRGLEGLDFEEFSNLIDTIGRVADQYDDDLRARFGSTSAKD
jgi:hypothetical protein